MKILLVYKMSTYDYYRHQGRRLPDKADRLNHKKFTDTHRCHYRTLRGIEDFLKSRAVIYRKVWRGRKMDYSPYDLIMTIGGDGTFLEAARHVDRQPILGINSDPRWSVGRYCAADNKNYRTFVDAFLAGRIRLIRLHRLVLTVPTSAVQVNILNDILICHKNPAAMSRYRLRIGKISEEQRGSGVWIATASGSSGAIRSSGGRRLPWTCDRWQYLPRELYHGFRKEYRLQGSSLQADESIRITSLMKDGMVFADGAHYHLPFFFGDQLLIRSSKHSLRVAVGIKKHVAC